MKGKATAANFAVKLARIVRNRDRRDTTKNPAIIGIDYSDDISLFRAVCVGVFYYENGGGKWEPAECHARTKRHSGDATKLWLQIEETLGRIPYGLDDVKKVYEHLEETFPETYRILVFTDTSGTHTVYNSGNNARHTISLYFNNGHFDLIKNPQKLLRKKYYCVDCEKTYENLKGHSNCKIKCLLCFRHGYGYPCKGELNMECPDCHKLFPNMDCMDAHKPYSCNTYHRCVYCNIQYRVRPERPGNGHRCAKPPATASIASEPATAPDACEQDGQACARTACTWQAHHGGVQQSILSWLVK
ncbi:hypothetical protein AAVH_39125 [Aphelenchoides avenae]|nr:hypothetical protein AAVH_39125 [Aphelenchus avenae]